MVIPVGPPGPSRAGRSSSTRPPTARIRVERSDIYGGRIVPFVPFTKLEGDQIVGVHAD